MSPPKRTHDHRYRDGSRSNTSRNDGYDPLRRTTASSSSWDDYERTPTPRSNQSRAYDPLRHTAASSSSWNVPESTPAPTYETTMNDRNLMTPAPPSENWERELEDLRRQGIHPNSIDSYLYQGQNYERPGLTPASPSGNWKQEDVENRRWHEVPLSNMRSWRENSYSPSSSWNVPEPTPNPSSNQSRAYRHTTASPSSWNVPEPTPSPSSNQSRAYRHTTASPSSWGDYERTLSPSYQSRMDRNLMTPAPPSENWKQELEDLRRRDIHPNPIDSYLNPNYERPGLTSASPSPRWHEVPPSNVQSGGENSYSPSSSWNIPEPTPSLNYETMMNNLNLRTPASPSGNWEQPPQDRRWHEGNPNSIDSYQNPNDERLNITPSQLPQAPSRRVIQPFTRPDDISVEKWQTLTKAGTEGRRAKEKRKFEEWKDQNPTDYRHYREYTNLYLSRSEAGKRDTKKEYKKRKENNEKRMSYAINHEKVPEENLKSYAPLEAYAPLRAYASTINEKRRENGEPLIRDVKELHKNIETYHARQREASEQGQMLSSAAMAGVFAVPEDFNVTSLQGLTPPPQSMGANYWMQQSTTSGQVLGDSLTAPIDLTASSSQDPERHRKRRKSSVSNSNSLWSSSKRGEMTRFERSMEKEPKEPSRVSTKDKNRTVNQFLGNWAQRKSWM